MSEIAVAALVIVASALVLLLVVFLAWFLDRSPREPILIVGFFFVWGLVSGAASIRYTAFLANVDEYLLVTWAGMLWPGLIILAPLFVMAIGLRSFDSPSDGFVYGCAVSLGFFGGCHVTWVLGPVAERIDVSSILIATLALVVYGCVVGFTSMIRRRFSKYALAVLAVLPACAIAVFGLLVVASARRTGSENLLWWVAGGSTLFVVVLVILVYYVEHRVISAVVDEEIQLGVLPEWTGDVFGLYRKRIRSSWWQLRRERTVISRIISRLAFRKRALSDLAHASGDVAWIEIVLLRKEIKQIFESRPDVIE